MSKRKLPMMRLAWRNTRRHTRRTLLTATAIAIAVAAMTYALSHIDGLLYSMLDAYARTESGHIRIRADGYKARERFLPVHMYVDRLDTVLATIRTYPGVKAALPRVRTTVLVDGGSSNRPGLLLGIDLKREAGYLDPATMVVEGRLPSPGQAEVMIGRPFAEKMEIAVGDSITLLGQTAYRSLGGIRLAVTGLAVSGMGYLDNMMLITPLDQAQQMTYLDNAATEIIVFADEPDHVAGLVEGLKQALGPVASGKMEILSWRDQGPLVKVLDTGRAAFSIILFILLAMAVLIIVNTLLMTVMERTREFGMQAALGMRRRDIVKLILMEGLTIGLIGASVGGLLGTAIALWFQHTGIDLGSATDALKLPFKAIVYPDWQLLYTVGSCMIGVLAAVLAAIYPAWRAVKVTPAEALRT